MTSPAPPLPDRSRNRRRAWTLGGAGVLLAATWAAYANSFRVPFHFDDVFAIQGNASLLHWRTAWSPPPGSTAGGRPVFNATLALNHAWGGDDVAGYHVINLLIHALAGLTLWGAGRRALAAAGRRGSWPDALSLGGALLWTLHPLQTEAVTYLSQRAESLMGLFYLLTLYCFMCGAAEEPVTGPAGGRARMWYLLAVTACFLGMGTKEVMVSAPVMVLLYDRTFVAGSFAAAWRRRRALYLGLAGTWVPLGYWVASLGGNREHSAGFGTGISWWDYLLTQFPALVRYGRLILWPQSLIFEYGPFRIADPPAILPQAILVLGLVATTSVGLVRRSPWAFAGAWFLGVLAPTLLVPSAIQMVAEHRLYLASAAVIGGVAMAADAALSRWPHPWGRPLCGLAVATCAAAFALLTFARNRDYRTGLALWSDTVAKRPNHAMARYNLGNELAKSPGGAGPAIQQYELALRLNPSLPLVHYNLAVLLEQIPGRQAEAVEHYQLAVRFDPRYVAAYNNAAVALIRLGRANEAIPLLEQALRLQPGSGALDGNLGLALIMCRRYPEAVDCYQRLLELDPNNLPGRRNLAAALQALGRSTEAATQVEQAARLEAGFRSSRP